VNDGQLNSPQDTVTITTGDSMPVANAGPDLAGVYSELRRMQPSILKGALLANR